MKTKEPSQSRPSLEPKLASEPKPPLEQTASLERRKEARYSLEAKVLVRKANGETLDATAVNISSSGMRLLCPDRSCPLTSGDEVTIEVELPERPDQPFSAWGLGKVAHVDDGGAGIQLYGGQFDPLTLLEDEQ